jgi:outer membrane protein TolC
MRTKKAFHVMKVVLTVFAVAGAQPGVGFADESEMAGRAPAAASSGETKEFGLNQFLEQVKAQHGNYKASALSVEAAKLQLDESQMLLSPTFFSKAQYTDDAKPQVFFTYDKQLITNYEAGFSKQTAFGLNGRLYYSATQTSLRNVIIPGSPTSMNLDTIQASPALELNFDLWRNFLGRETRSLIEAGEAGVAAKKHLESFKMKSILVQAETAYWGLALAREAVAVARASVDRAQKMFEWHQRRASLGLADQADFLQAQAALQSRRLDLRKAEDDERTASRNLNTTRGIDSSTVAERLATLTPELIQKIEVPERVQNRDDVNAAIEQSRAARAQAETSRQKYLPTLEVFGMAARNNTDLRDTNGGMQNAFSPSRPTNSVGVRLNAPLDIGLIGRVREGYEKDRAAAESTAQRKLFEQENDWMDLSDKFRQAKERLALYIQLEGVQKNKLEYERDRRTKGRTTTQMVLLSEMDYEQAQLGRIRTLSELLQLVAQMKLYGVENESR